VIGEIILRDFWLDVTLEIICVIALAGGFRLAGLARIVDPRGQVKSTAI
jgi:hypothetical protein